MKKLNIARVVISLFLPNISVFDMSHMPICFFLLYLFSQLGAVQLARVNTKKYTCVNGYEENHYGFSIIWDVELQSIYGIIIIYNNGKHIDSIKIFFLKQNYGLY